MGFELVSQPVAWIIALILLVACWPLSQRLRHERLQPLAAYLLFTTVLVLVSAIVFWVLVLGASALMPPASLEAAGAALVIGLLSLAPGLALAVWIVRRPQTRRMPR